MASLLLSIVSPVYAAPAKSAMEERTWTVEERTVIITAYYSPEPNQQKYFLGSYNADITFNGRGIQGADGTRVYPGMIAAPAELPFGTRIEIPSLDVVGTVHDRGGRIEMGNDGTVRIDLWMGKGEEGLARALQFGAQRRSANIYIPKNVSVPEERFNLLAFPAPGTVLKNLPSESQSLVAQDENPRYGDTSLLVASIQHALDRLQYFDHPITTYYGDVTRDAFTAFLRDAGVQEDGAVGNKRARETLAAHTELLSTMEEPLLEDETLLQGRDGRAVRVLQRVLKLIGHYHGDIDGEYDQELMSIVFKFQQEKNIVASPAETGAGIVGPQTRRALLTAWREYRIAKRGGAGEVVATLWE